MPHLYLSSAHGASGYSLVQNVIDTTVHVTHTPHTGLSEIGVLGQPVVYVVDVEAARSSSQTLHKGGNVELLQARAGAGQGLATTRGTR